MGFWKAVESKTLVVQVADHVRAHCVWRHVCYKNSQIPTENSLDAVQLVGTSHNSVAA